jgi:uncharacterized protein involved in exopolysaccharide biosynthesis
MSSLSGASRQAPINGTENDECWQLASNQIASNFAPRGWLKNANLLWENRRFLFRVSVVAFAISLCVAFAVPKQYESSTRIMPPDQGSTSAMMLAALASHGGAIGALSGLSGGLFSGHSTSALFIDLLHSGTVSGHLIDRFHLQDVYHKRYRIDTAKALAHRTTISDDKRSGVITVVVQDHDPARARDLAQGYIDELNGLVTRTTDSSAHQERVFIERRLQKVQADLEKAQLAMSEFSSTNGTVDFKEQARSMVDASVRLEAELLTQQSELESLRQIYGNGNIRVRESEVRIGTLRRELFKLSGTSAAAPSPVPSSADSGNADLADLYPALRQLPRLAVPYADLYREVKVQEGVYELLTQQYELARIQEAKDTPVVSVIDPPGLPEKKSFPPRLLLSLFLTALTTLSTATYLVMRHRWSSVNDADPRKILARQMIASLTSRIPHRPEGAP